MEKLPGEKQPRTAPSLFGKYRLLRPLKRSPFLESYLVRSEAPPHTLAILKRLHPLVVHRTDWVALFLDEARQTATLWHPNIIRIYDLGQIDGIPFFIQPYLFGKKLQTLLSRSRSLPIPMGMALLLIRQILEALDFAHGTRKRSGNPMAHGGLHPERIFIGFDGVVGVGDFGLGWLEDPRSAIRSRYRPPESISGLKGGEKIEATPGEDLFAVTAIFCELLGEFPEPIKPGLEPWGYFPKSIRSILIRGLAVDPAARFQTAREMIAAVEPVLQADYPRMTLSNYIQALFGNEMETERQTFAQSERNGFPLIEALQIERIELPSAGEIPPPPVPAPSTPVVLPLEPAPIEPPAVEGTAPIQTAGLQQPHRGIIEAPETAVKKKASSWQPIWWSLFGLLTTCFIGVLFFSLYRSPSEQTVFSMLPAPPPPPSMEVKRDPIAPPPATVGAGKEEAKEIAQPSASEGSIPPLPDTQQSTPTESPAHPAQISVPAVTEIAKGPAAPEIPKDRIQKQPTPSAPQNASISNTAPSGPIASSSMPVATVRRAPLKLKEEIPPQPKVEEIPPKPKTNEEMVYELIERQRRALQSLDRALYVQDLADGKGGLERQMGALFDGARPIRVEFEVFELKVREEEADLSLMQTARLQKGNSRFQQKVLLFWKLKKEKDRWKIERFNIIEKYPPVEVG